MNKKNINCPKLRALAKFKSIEKKYKAPKNKAFFSHMESLDSFFKYAQDEAKILGISDSIDTKQT